jgi:hypothetical protein
VRRRVKERKEGSMWTLSISRTGPAGLLFISLHRMEMLRYVRHSLMLRPILTLEIPSRW